MLKSTAYNDDMTVINIYPSNNKAEAVIKQNVSEI